jgi:hypothetical protein
LGVFCLGAGGFLFSAMLARGAAAEQRNEAYAELQKIYAAKVFPSEENIARFAEDQKALEAWLQTAAGLVHKGDLHIETNSPAVFKQSLQATVRKLSSQPGAVKGKVVEAGFKFGFDKYLGDSASLPDKENVWRLTQQLTVIERICQELYAANILGLESVQREAFDEEKEAQPQEEQGSGRRRRRDRQPDRSAPAAAAAVSGAGEFHSKQRFSFTFQARPAAFVEALNRLAAMEMFVVVFDVEFRKTDDPLMKYDARKKEKESKAAAAAALGGSAPAAPADPATVPHVERIVTDPELEPPVSVKLDIDVYSFEGV